MKQLADIIAAMQQGNNLLSLWELYKWLHAKVERSGIESLSEPEVSKTRFTSDPDHTRII